MSILNVNQIQPVGSGQTVTISATNIDTGSATFTGSSSATFNNGLNVTGGRVGVGTNSPTTVTQFQVLGTSAGNTATFGGINQGTSGRVGGIILGTDTDNSSRRLWGIRGEASVAGQMGIFYSSDNVTTPFSGTQTVSLTSGGNVKIENGNLVFSTSGTGIDFSATGEGSGTMTSELLDDYEEGTWTPEYAPSSGSFTSITYATQSGTYIKIGRAVYCHLDLATSSLNVTGASGNVRITGLPFNPQANTRVYAAQNNNWASNNPNCAVTTTSGQMEVGYNNAVNNTFNAVSDLNTTTATRNEFHADFVYYVSS